MLEPQATVVASALAALRAQGEAFTSQILSVAPGGSIHAVFAGGGFAHGEAWAARVENRIEVYSDLDLFVVADPSAVGAVREMAAALIGRLPATRGDVHFLRPVEAGVYDARDLAAQPTRPGTLALGKHGVWFHGDASRTPRVGESAMNPAEALYLLENRSSELARAEFITPEARRTAAVLALKTRIDVATAHLIASGVAVASRAACRAAIAAGRAGDTDLSDARNAFEQSDNLAAYLAGANAEHATVTARTFAARAWGAIAMRTTGAPALAGAVLDRCAMGRTTENAREFLQLRRRAGLGLGRALVLGTRFRLFSPRAALRVHAVAEQIAGDANARVGSSLQPLLDYCDALSVCLGEREGDRARRAALALRRIA